MKTSHVFWSAGTAFCFVVSLFAGTAQAHYEEDVKAITGLEGCYEVQFKFEETQRLVQDPSYKPSPTYQNSIIELAFLDQNSESGIHLQHILMLPGGHGVIKHWRQEWTYQPTNVIEYRAPNHWQKIPHGPTDGKWSQWIRSVDDSPRSAGIASWTHPVSEQVSVSSFWGGLTTEASRAPLPRREMEAGRKDYQLLRRSNLISTTPDGWRIEELNTKVRQNADGSETDLATETGSEIHKKVDPAKCAQAVQWWKDSKPVWDQIRGAWDDLGHRVDVIQIKPVVDGTPLMVKLNKLAEVAQKDSMVAKEVREKAAQLIQSHLVHSN
jgi:hypothetical protein